MIYELKDTDIKVTALIPGPTDTDFFSKAHMENTKAAQDDPHDPAEVAMSSAMPNKVVSARASKLMEDNDKD